MERKEQENLALKLYNQAIEFYKDGKNEEAFAVFIESAKLGDAYAAHDVGYMYQRGLGVEKDMNKAFEWYLIGAQRGDDSSMNNVGTFYRRGEFVEMNMELAREWYEKASLKGNKSAFYNLGLIYEKEYQNGGKAIEYFKKAADLGHKNAQYKVGDYYLEKKDKRAIYYLEKAAEQKYSLACSDLGKIYERGLCHTPVDIKKAIHYYELAAEYGFDFAYCSLAVIYFYKNAENIQDINLAKKYAQIAVEKGQDYGKTLLEAIEAKIQQSLQEVKKEEQVTVQTNEKVVAEVRVKGLCETCQICAYSCAVGAIKIEKGVPVIDEKECILCSVCIGACPYSFVRHY